jgi:hypothetical protein
MRPKPHSFIFAIDLNLSHVLWDTREGGREMVSRKMKEKTRKNKKKTKKMRKKAIPRVQDPCTPRRLRVLYAWPCVGGPQIVVVVVTWLGVKEVVVGDEARKIERARRPVRFVLAGPLLASWVAERRWGGGSS